MVFFSTKSTKTHKGSSQLKPNALDAGHRAHTQTALSKYANKENDMSPSGEHGIKLPEARCHKWGATVPHVRIPWLEVINCGPSVNRGMGVVAHDLIETIETKNSSGSRPLRSPGRR
jgi:hypothetical protein